MSRLYLRDNDLDHLRNGAHLSRVRQCSSFFERGFAKPPPKVLISSVSEDRSVLTPRLKGPAARSWSSEDFLTDPSHVDDVSNSVNPKDQASNVLKDSTCDSLHQSYAHLPSSVPESLIGDSAINSPDSWVENELIPERFSESHSDGSLWDSGNTWDVYRATPVDVTPVDEGFISSMEDRAPDEQSMTESYIDEGISSMDSNQEKIHRDAEQTQETMIEENQEDLENHDQDLVTDLTLNLREFDITEHGEPEPSVTLWETEKPRSSGDEYLLEVDPLNQIESDTEISPGQRPLKEPEQDETDSDGKIDSQTDYRFTTVEETEGRETEFSEEKRTDFRNVMDGINYRTETQAEKQDEELQDYQHCEESTSLEVTHPANNEETSKTILNVPLISITSEQEELEKELESDQGEPGEEIREEGNSEVQSPHCPDGLNHDRSEDDDHTENEHSENELEGNHGIDSVGNNDKNGIGQVESSPLNNLWEERDIIVQNSSSSSEDQAVNPDSKDLSDGYQDKPADSFPETKTEFIQENILDLFDIQENVLDLENTQENVLDPFDTQENILDLENIQENILGSLECQQDILDLVATQQTILGSGSSKLNGQIETPYPDPVSMSRDTDQFYFDLNRSSPTGHLLGDLVEPMDLFYPDPVELMPPEPDDTHQWPSVLSVSALQPAPPSNRPEGRRFDLLDEDFMGEEEEDVNVRVIGFRLVFDLLKVPLSLVRTWLSPTKFLILISRFLCF